MKPIKIANRLIGRDYPPYIVAELSSNHNGKLQSALDTISAAKKCGADAIKLQTYSADTMTIDCESEDFIIRGGLWDGFKLYNLYELAQTPYDWHQVIFDHANKLDITCFSTPFDETAVDLLEDLNTPAYKVASFEITDLPLLRYIASTNKPMIVSTGLANFDEIEEMIATVREAGCKELILLHCISAYPAPIEESNLLTISDMRERFDVPIGLSDHSNSNLVSLAAISLGSVVIEKHFIMDRGIDSPDSAFSIVPEDLSRLCRDSKATWMSLGKAGYERKSAEENNVKFRRSLYFVKDMNAGDKIESSHIRRIRPGYGLSPKHADGLIGRKLKCDINAGTATSWDIIGD